MLSRHHRTKWSKEPRHFTILSSEGQILVENGPSDTMERFCRLLRRGKVTNKEGSFWYSTSKRRGTECIGVSVYFLFYIQPGNIKSSVYLLFYALSSSFLPIKKKRYRVYWCENVYIQFYVPCPNIQSSVYLLYYALGSSFLPRLGKGQSEPAPTRAPWWVEHK